MRDFKFFQKGSVDDSQMLNEATRATASFNADTPEGYMSRRRQYFDAQIELYNRLNYDQSERFCLDRDIRRFETTQPTLNQEEVTRRINGGMSQEEILRRRHEAFEREKPNWKTKIKIFYWKFKYNSVIETNSEMLSIFLITISITLGVGFIIAKILNVW